jgi:hypothetical protein
MGAANESSLLFAFPDSKCKWRLSLGLERGEAKSSEMFAPWWFVTLPILETKSSSNLHSLARTAIIATRTLARHRFVSWRASLNTYTREPEQ